MSTFRITKPDSFKDYSFGKRLIDIITALSLPTPSINGSEMTKFHKKGVWVIHITQPGARQSRRLRRSSSRLIRGGLRTPPHHVRQHSSPISSRRGREGRRRTTGKKLGSTARRGGD
jgi:hypothetical protein